MLTQDYARFASFDTIEAGDLQSFQVLTGSPREIRRRHFVRLEGDPNPEVYRLRSGWAICSVGTADGGRQITKVHLPGDLVGLPSMACPAAAETIQAATDIEIEVIPLDAFATVFREHPRLAALLFLWSLEERQQLMTRMTVIGRLSGAQRIAAWLYLLHRRVVLGEPTPTLSFAIPLNQTDLADATGMSPVHANRGLMDLRKQGLATWRGNIVTIHDLDRLAVFSKIGAEFQRSTRWMSSIRPPAPFPFADVHSAKESPAACEAPG